MAGDDWSREEVEATVGDYFAMLRCRCAEGVFDPAS
jgi:hypothetical protein